MSADIVVREASQKDAGAIATILREVGWFEKINREEPATIYKAVAELLEREDENYTVLVAERKGEVIGYAAVHWYQSFIRGNEGYVSELFIRPAATGNGIGSTLLQAIHEYAFKRGCQRLMLINFRHRESYERGFYATRGWEEQPLAAVFTFVPSRVAAS